MNCLAVDTSGNHLTVVLLKGEQLYKRHLDNALLKHSVTLMPQIEDILEEANLSLKDIDVFGSSIGPGSFTGIRIGVSTVKALAFAGGKKVFAVTSFKSLAYNSDESKILAVIDAKHSNYYVCGFENGLVSIPPKFISIDELESIKQGYKVVSDCELDFDHIKGDYLSGFIKAVKEGLSNATSDVEILIPLYVKKSQAEEER